MRGALVGAGAGGKESRFKSALVICDLHA